MTTLADHIEDFLADLGRRRNWRERTIRAYRHDLLVAARQLPMPLIAITVADLDAVLHDDRLAISTRHRRAGARAPLFLCAGGAGAGAGATAAPPSRSPPAQRPPPASPTPAWRAKG